MEIEYKTSLENLIAAAYLSGAAEALNKARELTPEDLEKNLEDLKPLRRIFLRRAEEEGYHRPVHHIEEAKKKSFELLTQKTKFPNVNTRSVSKPFSIFGMFDKKTPNVSNVKTSTISNTNTKPKNITNTNISKAVNAVTSTSNSSHVVSMPIVSQTPSYAPPVLSLGGKRKL